MEFLTLVAALTIACLIVAFLHNIITRVKFALGFRPPILDDAQSHIVCKSMAKAMVVRAKQIPDLYGSDGSPAEEDRLMTELYCFAREVIVAYAQQMALPTFDMTPDPPGIRQRRTEIGEVPTDHGTPSPPTGAPA